VRTSVSIPASRSSSTRRTHGIAHNVPPRLGPAWVRIHSFISAPRLLASFTMQCSIVLLHHRRSRSSAGGTGLRPNEAEQALSARARGCIRLWGVGYLIMWFRGGCALENMASCQVLVGGVFGGMKRRQERVSRRTSLGRDADRVSRGMSLGPTRGQARGKAVFGRKCRGSIMRLLRFRLGNRHLRSVSTHLIASNSRHVWIPCYVRRVINLLVTISTNS
jgi:hypothetical protein